ncbi:hypothetical protein SEA_SIXAMA_95 [Gordonia phage Sixama]|uniref:Tail assembly chaperone n=1 Tax=Gordonia phage Sixama TaxID=2653271 RepID=A0A5Q2F5B5_9CAUD|nr:hypothetical protein PP302_gp095 [Gordonia phage Sixama]QGF20274.1 hypothetical protein SEA_SIXAMA_95 [Gordonia phage Sixama]
MTLERKKISFGSRTPQPIAGLDMELNDQVFKVRPKMSGIALLRVISSMEGEDEGAAANAMIDFISSAFLKEDRERGMEYLEFGEPAIELEELKDIVQALITQYTGNFTDPSQSSTSGSADDGSITTAEPYETVSTSQTLTPSDSLL